MSKLAGELCAGIRLHAIDTFAYTRDVVVPAIAAGAAKAGRKLADIDLVGAPFLAIGADEGEVRKAMQSLKQHVSFYASTRTYHTVLAHHGWEEVGLQLHRLSREYGIPPEAIATIGDMPNDVLMFAHSGLSIAMGQSSEDVKRSARRVTRANTEEGFAEAIERFVLSER